MLLEFTKRYVPSIIVGVLVAYVAVKVFAASFTGCVF